MQRRMLLKQALAVGGGMVLSAIAAVPAFIAAISPAITGARRDVWQRLGPLQEFPLDEITQATAHVPREDEARGLREKAVYVWRPSEEEVVVFSRNCTDLSCPVTYDPGSECFFCPCHGGIFAKNGDRLAGPPNRPLYRYATRVRNGKLEIDLSSLPPMT